VISQLAVRKIAFIAALPDERYWQSRHQQARRAIGASLNRNLTAPQRHRPVMGLVILITFVRS
jgi:hypothetical protein